MKKLLIVPVLFSVLLLGGCSGYYSQNQVNTLIQQRTAASQTEIDTLKQQVSDLLQKVASTTTAVNNQAQAPAVINLATSSEAASNSALKGKYVTYLISQESALKYCSGDTTDNSDAYRKTITTEVNSNILTANVTTGAISKVDLVKQILSLIGACGQADLSRLDIKVINGTVQIPWISGWAGISIEMCSCVPKVEVNLLRLPGINRVVWLAYLPSSSWPVFENKSLNYNFQYLNGFFQQGPTVSVHDCDVQKFASECPFFGTDQEKIDQTKYGNLQVESRVINGQQFCVQKKNDAAAGSLFTTHDYINVNGSKCDDMQVVVQTPDGCDSVADSSALNDPKRLQCENNINVTIPNNFKMMESTFTFN